MEWTELFITHTPIIHAISVCAVWVGLWKQSYIWRPIIQQHQHDITSTSTLIPELVDIIITYEARIPIAVLHGAAMLTFFQQDGVACTRLLTAIKLLQHTPWLFPVEKKKTKKTS